jgi:hypothetical protein
MELFQLINFSTSPKAIGSKDYSNESRQSGEETSPSRKKAAIPESHRGLVCLISVDLSARKSWYRY